MHYQPLTPQDATGLLSLIGLIALFIGLLFLTRRMQRKRLEQTQESPSPASKPFPQTASYTQQIPSFTQTKLLERQAELRQAFEQWQTDFLMRGLEGNTEFVRGESLKRGLRYQVSSTSLAQGLAMFIQVQMAQDGDLSRGRFERMLAHLLAHPAQEHPALSSWLSMPDLPTSPRLEPDLHSEAWILFGLMLARQQWGSLLRFNLEQIIQERSQALLEAFKSHAESQGGVFSPLLMRIIAKQMPDSVWQTQAEADWQTVKPLLREEKGLPGRLEALSLLQIGLDGLFFPENGVAERSDLSFARLKRALSSQESLEGELEEGFSRLASLSCCVPMALLYKSGEHADQLWASLSQAQPAKQDAVGACLRIIAMMSMAGSLWLEAGEAVPPVTTAE